MQKLDYLLVEQIEAFVRDYYEEELNESNEELVVKDTIAIIRYMLKYKEQYEMKEYMNSILELLGIEYACSKDREILKIFKLSETEERTDELDLKDIKECLYYRNEFCFNLLKDLLDVPVEERDPNIDYEEVQSLYYYFEAYNAGNPMRVLFLNEINDASGLNDHAKIVRHVLEDICNRPIN
jgi:hypothetical protein